MTLDTAHCDDTQLQLLLDDALPEPQASAATQHLAACASCRARFESLAGAPQWWHDTSHGLQLILAEPSAYHSSIASLSNVSSNSDNSDHLEDPSRDDAFVSDFAVDFLEPSDNP